MPQLARKQVRRRLRLRRPEQRAVPDQEDGGGFASAAHARGGGAAEGQEARHAAAEDYVFDDQGDGAGAVLAGADVEAAGHGGFQDGEVDLVEGLGEGRVSGSVLLLGGGEGRGGLRCLKTRTRTWAVILALVEVREWAKAA